MKPGASPDMSPSAGKLVLTIPEFVNKWRNTKLSERSAAQSHFIDLCTALDQQTPVDVDSEGNTYTFEKGVKKNSGGDGFADVWKRNYFAWEYKRKNEDLGKAYQQLLKYREALENPPLLVVCDLDRFEVHTNWTNTPPEVYSFDLNDLLFNKPTTTCKVPPVDVLRSLFMDPEQLKPGQTTAQVTTQAAKEFSTLAEGLRHRGIPAERAAHFIMRLLFCLFAEDIGLLPDRLFTRLIQNNRRKPAEFTKKLRQLFAAMANEGGSFGPDDIPYFDGGLFMDDKAYDLTVDELGILARAADLNWGGIEPAIFGTLFERILDPDKRSQIGAHYTSKEDIMLIVEPVLMEPLRREWEAVREKAMALLEDAKKRKGRTVQRELSKLLADFVDKIASVRVLDPACGSGNFLYVALKMLLDLEKQVSVFASSNQLSRFFVRCRPSQLYGIESNIYAHQVASVSVWIGFLQWQKDNGVIITDNPIMQPLENIQQADAILRRDNPNQVDEPDWPEVEVIVGNPPFLGDKKMRAELGDSYVDALRALYGDRLPGQSDLVCYWFEKARSMIENNRTKRAGLLATQGIRGGANRRVLERIKKSGDIFWAYSDRDWVLDGANVHVSMVGFDSGEAKNHILNGIAVSNINSDLTASAADLTKAAPLEENKGLAFIGTQKGGKFDLAPKLAKSMLGKSGNPNQRSNSDVIKPWVNASDITGSRRGLWIIDYGTSMELKEAAEYEAPFEYLKQYVYPVRKKLRREGHRTKWWIHAESRPGMRDALRGKDRYIVTPRHSKHRLFVWLDKEVVPDSALVVVARDDDYFFGVLHSKVHELWARRTGTQVREAESGFRYTPTSTFETFPFPWIPGAEPTGVKVSVIAATARELVDKRNAWLASGNRTLTQLYNQSPSWLLELHQNLDAAVLSAYGWALDASDDEIINRLLNLNSERSERRTDTAPRVLYQEAEIGTIEKKAPASVRRSSDRKRIPSS
jgi:type II restriction/modification system DNA methylase subunit YeeA